MAKRKPLPRLTTDEKVQRLLRRDQTLYEMDDPGDLDRRPPMAGAAYALSLMDTEMGSDPAKIEARARMIAKMRADAERERIDDLVRRGLVQEYKVREKPPRTADVKSGETATQAQQIPTTGFPNMSEQNIEKLKKSKRARGGNPRISPSDLI
tara:strand:+ start:39 stop:497 length:459 start_codon:yes stop_codon:yes gene_type:complete